MRTSSLMIIMGMSLAGCAPDLRVDHPFDGNGKCTDPATKMEVDCDQIPLFSIQRDGDARTAIVDATNKASEVYVDLDGDQELKTDAAFESNSWDLAFKRFEVFTNGGSGNPSGVVRVAVLKGQDYDALTKAPSDGYQQDGSTAVFASVEGGWYYYDLGAHKLTPNPLVYVVNTSSGAYMKFQMVSYYDSNGTAARMTIKYAPLQAP